MNKYAYNFGGFVVLMAIGMYYMEHQAFAGALVFFVVGIGVLFEGLSKSK